MRPLGLDSERAWLVDQRVTLNGAPARITGYRNPFATVTDLRTGLSAEWSWESAYYVVTERNGEFRS